MALPTYRGFSTADYLSSNTFRLTGIDLVKRDLMNHIYTIPGERVHLPDFGTRIPLIAFEPLDEQTVTIVKEDLKKVFDYDPRVELVDMAVSAVPAQNMIVAFIDVRYIDLNTTETLKLEFNTGS